MKNLDSLIKRLRVINSLHSHIITEPHRMMICELQNIIYCEYRSNNKITKPTYDALVLLINLLEYNAQN
jgi:hypothetical protein